MRDRPQIAGALVVALLCAGSVSADTIISNLPGNDLASLLIGGANDVRWAVGFTTPSGSPLSLDSITLRLRKVDDTDQPLTRLYSDIGGNPGTPLVTFSDPTRDDIPNVPKDQVLTPLSPFTLNPSTTHWIVLENLGWSPILDWMASNPAQQPTGVAAFAGSRLGIGGVPDEIRNDAIGSFAVNATAGPVIPEPSALVALVGLAVTGLIGHWWRRGKAA